MRKIPLTIMLSSETITELEKISSEKRSSISATARSLIEKGVEQIER